MTQVEASRQRFKVSAVRRPRGDYTSMRIRRVADEEIVHELWSERSALEHKLAERIGGMGGQQLGVRLTAIDDSAGILCEFEFDPHEVEGEQALPELSPAVIGAVSEVLESGLGTPVAVSASPEPPTIDEAPESKQPTPWSQVAPILAFVATGIGVIGLVTFVGGAVVWARLNAAGFPAAPALGVLPSQDLLVIGAETLVPQVIVALVVVVVLTLLYAFAVVVTRLIHRETSDKMRSAARSARQGESGVAMFCFIATALLVMLALFKEDLDPGQFSWAVAVVVVCALLAAVVASSTASLVYLAVTTFVLAGVFESYIAYSRESSDERVRGAAVVRDNKKAIPGIFVAEGSGRVYLARVSDDGGNTGVDVKRSRLVGLAKDQVTDVAIGDRKPINEALTQAVALAKELCALEPRVATSANATPENCRTAPPGHPQP